MAAVSNLSSHNRLDGYGLGLEPAIPDAPPLNPTSFNPENNICQ